MLLEEGAEGRGIREAEITGYLLNRLATYRLHYHRKILRSETELVGIESHTPLTHEVLLYQLHQHLESLYLTSHLLTFLLERSRKNAAKTIGYRHQKQLL